MKRFQYLTALMTMVLLLGMAIGPTQAHAPLWGATPLWGAKYITFTVNLTTDQPDPNTGDDLCDIDTGTAGNQCTLRAAIQQANATGGTEKIRFLNSGMTIALTSPLPAIAITGTYGLDGVDIEGKGAILDGSSITPGSNSVGLEINGSRSVIQGFTIQDFSIGIKVNGTLNLIGIDDDAGWSENERNIIISNDEIVDPATMYETGIYITGSSNIVAGNYIGIDGFYGNTAVPNDYGILVIGSNNRIGTDGDGVEDAAERNIISGNARTGILITGHDLPTPPYSNVIAGNYIGTDVHGAAARPNGNGGIHIYEAGNYNRIGTNGDGSSGDAAEGNLVSGNYYSGIDIDTTNYARIAGNRVGLDAAGLVPLKNHSIGVSFSSANDCILGTNGDGNGDALEGNLISGNGNSGVHIYRSWRTRISGNWIGLNVAGAAAVPNEGSGLSLAGLFDGVVGTDGNGVSDLLERNVISGNQSYGIYANCGSTNTTNTAIAGNYIGTNTDGDAAVPNGATGLFLSNCTSESGNTIGGSLPAQRNLISGNGSYGILMEGTKNTVVQGNWIGKGTDPNDYEVGNTLEGIIIRQKALSEDYSTNNHILDNLIAHNKGDGIQVGLGSSDLSTGNRLENNLMYDNDGHGIDLGTAGAEMIDNMDPDTGPNGLQNFPELTSVSYSGINLRIITSFNSTPNNNFILWYYRSPSCDANGYGEGRYLVGTYTVSLPAGGEMVNFQANLGWVPIETNDYITAVAVNNANGNSSEFSACRQFTGSVPAVYQIYLPQVSR